MATPTTFSESVRLLERAFAVGDSEQLDLTETSKCIKT